MLRDFNKFMRRTSSKNEEVENIPVNPRDSLSSASTSSDACRPPLNTIQDSALTRNPKFEHDPVTTRSNKIERTPTKTVKPKTSDHTLPLGTPDRHGMGFSAKNKFGWANKNDRTQSESRDDFRNMTPRGNRAGGRASSNCSESNSTQSTPTKSVSKPPNSGLRSKFDWNGNGSARGGSFASLYRGLPIPSGPAMVINTFEVPHFDLKEDPSFWMDHNVQVLIRVRPLNSMEKGANGYNRCVKQESAQSITWIGQLENRFTFDHVACETVDQETLFRMAGLPMVENCLSGYNSCVFAYGQTGSGKTYTMLGELEDLEVKPSPHRGMTPRIFEFLFARIQAEEESRRDEKLKYNCKCSFLEIYNEQITDLLDPTSTNLLLREDVKKGVYVENLSEFEVRTVSDILKLLTQGSLNRKVAATNMNRESSRSHSVFTCVIESQWEKDSSTNLRFARLNLVDLAGSERQKTSGAEGERLKEAANINKSLSTLGHVIMILVDVANGKQRHIPYRDSRLTFLLQDSLGGNSKTMIIANVSPSICCSAETLNTLKFAQRAKLIQNNAVVNEDSNGDVIALQHQIRLLKEEISLLKRQNISRSLSFGSAPVDPIQAGGDVCTGNTHTMDQHLVDLENESKGGVRMSTKQLKALETTLAGALRREQMAETSIKKLEAEIEQLNRLVRQREEDTRSTKMMLRFREDKIQRMESLLGGSLATDSYLLDENKALSEENQLLQAKVDRNPEVTRFALENIRHLDQLRRFQEFYEEGERDILLAEVFKLRDQMLQFLDGNSKQNNNFNSNIPSEEALRMSKEYNGLHSELSQTICELEKCKLNLNTCLEDNTKLQREIHELQSKLKSLTAASHGQANNTRNEQVMNEEEILILQLELDIVKIILKEERSSRAEIEEREMCLYRDFEAAKHQLLLMSKRYEDADIELKEAKSVIEALGSQQILSINEMEDLRKSNSDYENRVRELELEIIAFKEQLCKKEFRDLSSSGNFRRENSSLQSRLKRMHDSLDNAKRLNLFYQKDRDNLASNEEEMDEVRRQVEAETAEVIVCLQEELTILQQQVEDCHSKEMNTKGRMMLLESQLREQLEKISNLTEDNQRLATELEHKERERRILSEEWELLASEVEEILVHGNETLIDASDQLDLISSSFPQKRVWISEQVGRLTRIICEKELLIEELGRCLEEANDKRSDVECMLKSLKGAALVINEARQQECDEKDKEIFHLMSELSEKSSKVRELELRMMMAEHRISEVSKCATVAFVVINRLSETAGNHLNALKEKDIRLNVSAEMNLKMDNLLSDKTAVVEDAEKQILYLRNEVAELEETCTDLRWKLSEEKQHSSALEQKIEHIEENDIFTTREKLSELKAGVSSLKSCMNLSTEHGQRAVMSNSQEDSTCFHDNEGRKSDVKLIEDFVDIRNDTSDHPSEGKNFCCSLSGLKPMESRKACKDLKDKDVTILLLKKEIESALLSLNEVQVEMAKLRNEKEEMLVFKKLNEKSLKCITAQVLTLKATMSEFEKQLQVQTEVASHKLQALEQKVRETRTCFYQAKEVLELEVCDAKMIAAQKTAESSCIFAKFEEAQYTMKEADIMINELIIANETTKLEIERLKQKEFKLIDERDTLIDEVRCLQSINASKDQQLEDLEKQFGSNLSETRDLVLELEGIVADVQTSYREKFKLIAQDFQCMKSQHLDSTKIVRSWLENIWSEMIVKDCALSVLHLCHMGILLETVTGQNAENVLLQHGLSESNALIGDLREHNSKSKKELDMCSVLKGKLLADIKNGFDRISRKEEETGELSVRLFTFEKKISDIQLQEELMFERSNYIGSQLANLVKELESSNINIMTSLLNEKLLQDKEDVLKSEADLLMLDFCSKDVESFVLALELAEISVQNAETERINSSYCYVVENLKKEMIFTKLDAALKMQLLTDEEGKVTVLQKEVEEARNNWEDLLEKLKQSSLRVKQLDELNKALEAECQKLQKDLQTNDLELRSSFSTISKLEKENNLLRSEILKLERQNSLVLQDLEGTKFKFESSCSRIDSFDMENQKLQDKIFSLEASISTLQSDLAMKNTELSKLQHSQSVMMEDLCLKNQDLQIYTNKVDGLKEENISLRNDVTCHISTTYVNILKCIDSLSSVDKTCNRLWNKKSEEGFLVAEKMLQEMYKVQEVISKVTKDFESLEHHVEELMSENKILRAELSRKDKVLEGLLFDLSLLQESASNSKDWKDEMEEMEASLNALQDDLALKSKELHETVSHNRMLEAQLQERINMTSTFESDISSQQESLKFLSCETMKLRAHVEDILAEKNSIEEKLMERIKINESLEMELQEMGNALGQMNETIETLRCDMNELAGERDQLHSEVLILSEKLEHEQSRSEENEVAMLEALKLAESRKIICEEKDAEVKLLERSVEELECTINVLEDKVDIVKGEAERQRLQREELEMELHNVKHQMQSFKNADADMNRHLVEKEKNLDEALKQIKILEKDIFDKAAEIAQCKAHISELNLYAEAQASEYKQKFKALEAMAEQVRPESHSTHAINASSNKIERSSSRPRGSGSPFKCIGLGLAHQMKSEKDEELSAAKLRIDELESLAVNRQKEILTLNARLAAAESMTHDVIRDLLGVKLDMTNYVSLLDNQQVHKITEKARLNSLESQVKDEEVFKLKHQLNDFIEERQGWLEEIDRKQAEIIAAQIALEKIRQQHQSLKTENEMLKIENVNCKKVVVDLEGEVKKLSGQQNIQQRIHHHAKIKDENNKLKVQNEELGAKLRRTEVFLSRMREELAQYRYSSGGNPYINFDEEQRLNEKLKVTEEERMQLAQKLLGLCTSILKAAGVTKSVADISPDAAEEALEQLKSKVTSQERELQSLRLKNKLNNERNRLNEIMSETSPMRIRNDENCQSPRKLSQASFLSALDR